MKIDNWLDQPLKIFTGYHVSKKYQSVTNDIRNYYLPDDKEIVNNTISYNSDAIGTQIYDNIKGNNNLPYVLHIHHNTRRYELDTIFRRLIDRCILNDLRKNKLIDNDNSTMLVTPDMRKSFYEFAKRYSI